MENEMTGNVGLVDRMIRILFGAALIMAAELNPDMPYFIGGWIGAVLVATGLFGWCGLYKMLGISTLQKTDA